MKINLNNIKIDKRSEESVYVTIGDWVIYLDNSTGEHFIDTWKKGGKKPFAVYTKREIAQFM